MINLNKVMAELKKEINETLFFFVKMDLEIYEKISLETVSAFKKQNVKFPERLKSLINDN